MTVALGVLTPGLASPDLRVFGQALAYQGATDVTLTDTGRLAVKTPVGRFEEDRLVVYQEIDGRRVPVEARYTLTQAETGE